MMAGILAVAGFILVAAGGLWALHVLGGKFVEWSVREHGPVETQGRDWDAAHGAAGAAIDQDATPAMHSPERMMQ